jgi:succinate dehydrogenase / fumarate reductase membrane anchor subunit
MSVNYGSKRIVVGAHYGLRDWLSQRITGALMALFTVVLLAQLLFTRGPVGYDVWAGIFASQWMKVLTFVVIASLLYHVGRHARHLDGLRPAGRHPSRLAGFHDRLACGVRGLGHSSALENLKNMNPHAHHSVYSLPTDGAQVSLEATRQET